MKLMLVLAILVSSLSGFAAEKQFCGKITHITLHIVDGRPLYNYGMTYGTFSGGSNSFGWLSPNNEIEKEVLEMVKLAKSSDLTFCAPFGQANVQSEFKVQ